MSHPIIILISYSLIRVDDKLIFTIISYFDNRIGPSIYTNVPRTINSPHLNHIPLLMDLYKSGFFIHECGDLRTANLIFTIPSPRARGRKELLMLTMGTVNEEYYLNLNSFKEIMEYFAFQLINRRDLYKGFHLNDIPDGLQMQEEIFNLLNSFYEVLPGERAIFMQNVSQVMTFGLSQSGKDSILRRLQKESSTSLNYQETISDIGRIKSF